MLLKVTTILISLLMVKRLSGSLNQQAATRFGIFKPKVIIKDSMLINKLVFQSLEISSALVKVIDTLVELTNKKKP